MMQKLLCLQMGTLTREEKRGDKSVNLSQWGLSAPS